MAFRPAIFTATAGISACSLLMDTSTLVAERSDGAIEAAADAEETSTPTPDVAIDALDAGNDSRASLCAAYADAYFCDDFDVPPLGSRWDEIGTTQGSLALGVSTPFSPPSFLEATLDHDIRIRHSGATTAIEQVNYTLSQSQVGSSFAKSLDATWQEIVVHVSFSTRKLDVTVGGAPVFAPQDLLFGDWSGPVTVAVFAGLPFAVKQDVPVVGSVDDLVILTE